MKIPSPEDAKSVYDAIAPSMCLSQWFGGDLARAENFLFMTHDNTHGAQRVLEVQFSEFFDTLDDITHAHPQSLGRLVDTKELAAAVESSLVLSRLLISREKRPSISNRDMSLDEGHVRGSAWHMFSHVMRRPAKLLRKVH